MARVVAVFDDLLLGSNVLGMLRAAGHEARLVGDAAAATPDGADVLVVDLATEGFDGVALVERLGADAAANGRTDDMPAAIEKFAPAGLDAALLTAGGEAAEKALRAVRDGGRVALPKGIQPESNP